MVKAMTPSKTPMKAQDTPKSIKKRKAEQIVTPAKTPKSIKEKLEMVTPKSTKKMKAEKTPQVQQKQQTPQVPKSEKKNKNSLLNLSLEKSPKKDSKDERMGVAVQFPLLKCCKAALLQMLDTDKPIILREPIVFSLQYSDRNSAVDAVKKLETLSNSAVKVTAKLSGIKQGEAVKTKRIVYVPKKAPNDEAVSVLTKAYGASEVEQKSEKSFFYETKLMVLTFASEEAANAADKVKDKMYHGIELMISSFFTPNKRELDEKQEGQDAKKMKKEKDAPAKKESDDEEEEEEEEDDDDDDDDDDESDDMEVDVMKMRKEVAATRPDEEDDDEGDDDNDDDEEDDDDDDDDEE